MPRIEIAQCAGACYGVERALDMVRDAIQASVQPVSTLGPLIHNPQVVSELEQRGVSTVESVAEADKGTLVLRTHGVVPEIEHDARARGLNVLDATCPFVTKSHIAARKLADDGYQVLVVGEAGHPEVDATAAHAPGSRVVGSVEDLDHIQLEQRVGIVVQTTQTKSLLEAVVAHLVGQVEELHVANTICSATTERQQAAAALAQCADCMVVIGGKNSANTTRLAEICQSLCMRSYHIETVDELDVAWFEQAELIGVTAGASTPESHIKHVVHEIAQLTDTIDSTSTYCTHTRRTHTHGRKDHTGKEDVCHNQ